MELPINYTDIRDEPQYQLDGSVLTQKRVTFYLGKFGPFVELVPNDAQFGVELARRAEALRRTLQQLPQ